MVDYKNPLLGVRLGQRAAEEGFDIRVRFVGEGPALTSVFESAKAAGISNRLEASGRLSHHDTLTLIRKSRALVLPSLCFENSPMTVYEALAAGTPPIVSSRGGAGELFTNGIHGYCVDPQYENPWWDAFRSLIDGDERYQRMSAAARQHARANFSLDEHCRRIETLYDRVIAG